MASRGRPLAFVAVIAVLVAALAIALNADARPQTRSFVVEGTTFLKDGEPYRYVSGGIHYFRTHPAYWRDRLTKLRAMGCNAIQTYVAWNLHEPSPGVYDFAGGNDLFAFLDLAQDIGFDVILRVGPYICAEWEWGGHPAWLLANGSIPVRTLDPRYMGPVRQWLSVLLPALRSYLYSNGGPVIMVQVENEYGLYGCDQSYLAAMAALFREFLPRDEVLLFTVNPADDGLACGSLCGTDVFATVDFGTPATTAQVASYFAAQRKCNNGTGPFVDTEFYTGWLDHWGEPHSVVSTAEVVGVMEEILAMGGSVNMYMAEGGTSFGFMNGANSANTAPDYRPQPTSYDYNAPLSEAGDLRPKYEAVAALVKATLNGTGPWPPAPPNTTKADYGVFHASQCASLWVAIATGSVVHGPLVVSDTPLTFEAMGQAFGYVLYETTLVGQARTNGGPLAMPGVQDAGYVFGDGSYLGVINRTVPDVTVEVPTNVETLSILVENRGRLNFGSLQDYEERGIVNGSISLAGVSLRGNGWNQTRIPLSAGIDWEALPWVPCSAAMDGPAFYSVAPNLSCSDDPCPDTFLSLPGWTKGQIFVNGFNAGRYWNVGPQDTYYLPGPVVNPTTGTDQVQPPTKIVLFELEEAPADLAFALVATPVLNGPTAEY